MAGAREIEYRLAWARTHLKGIGLRTIASGRLQLGLVIAGIAFRRTRYPTWLMEEPSSEYGPLVRSRGGRFA